MSEEHESPKKLTDSLTNEGKEALSALRGIWKAQGQTSADLDEACGNTKACKSMENVGFHGLADDSGSPAKADAATVGTNVRAAWKMKLEREGKTGGQGSIRDLVLGSSDKQE